MSNPSTDLIPCPSCGQGFTLAELKAMAVSDHGIQHIMALLPDGELAFVSFEDFNPVTMMELENATKGAEPPPSPKPCPNCGRKFTLGEIKAMAMPGGWDALILALHPNGAVGWTSFIDFDPRAMVDLTAYNAQPKGQKDGEWLRRMILERRAKRCRGWRFSDLTEDQKAAYRAKIGEVEANLRQFFQMAAVSPRAT